MQGSGVGAGGGSGVTSTTVPNFPQNEPQVSLPPTDGPDISAPLNPNILSRAKLTTHGEREAKARERYLRSILGASFNDLATAEAIQEQYSSSLMHYHDADHWDATFPIHMRN